MGILVIRHNNSIKFQTRESLNFVNSNVRIESFKLYHVRTSYSISCISSSCAYFFSPNNASLIAFRELLSYAPPNAYPEMLLLKKKLNRSIWIPFLRSQSDLDRKPKPLLTWMGFKSLFIFNLFAL